MAAAIDHKANFAANADKLEEKLKQHRTAKFQQENTDIEPDNNNSTSAHEQLIHDKAFEILRHGDPVDYIIKAVSRRVLGADRAIRTLVYCISAMDISNSRGLHPKASGESGSGKSWILYQFAHYLPPSWVQIGSGSNLSAFYHNESNKNKKFWVLDDYRAGNETLDSIIKRTSTRFHEIYEHPTVIKQQAVKLFIGSEQVWAITSVDGSQDIQVLNRQVPFDADDSIELTKAVNDSELRRAATGEPDYPHDETVEVCRMIWQILRDDAEAIFGVKIPFSDRIQWMDLSNRRNLPMFLDFIKSNAFMNMNKREIDEEGFILAEEADFKAAQLLLDNKNAEEFSKRLTAKERQAAEIISAAGEISRNDLAEAMGLTPQRISGIINGYRGRDGELHGGLKQKLNIIEDQQTVSTPGQDGERISNKRILYSTKNYNPLAGYDSIVRLKPKNESHASDAIARNSGEIADEIAYINNSKEYEIAEIAFSSF